MAPPMDRFRFMSKRPMYVGVARPSAPNDSRPRALTQMSGLDAPEATHVTGAGFFEECTLGREQAFDWPDAHTERDVADSSATSSRSQGHGSGVLPSRTLVHSTDYVGELHPLMSLGTQLHPLGRCTPCKFYRSRRGCRDGIECTLCHYPHEEMTYSEVRKAVKERGPANRRVLREHGFLRMSIADLLAVLPPGPEVVIETCQPCAGGSLSSTLSRFAPPTIQEALDRAYPLTTS
mmetsp:Transcript_49608/g.160378  ORF Transcript_49608/g.160378 Transcript_49608/m.160378 type:complete len:235 (-) Transcript_49608:119-823(-)